MSSQRHKINPNPQKEGQKSGEKKKQPVFKKIFNPESRPERLEEFISLCLRKKARILKVLPDESERLTEEVFEFRYQKREVIEMYSKALSILDANTVEYMVGQQKKEIRKLTKALENKTKALEEEHREVERLHALLEAMETKK